MGPVKPPVPSLPAASAECVETVQFAQPGAILQQIPTRQFRSIEGKIRFDFGTSSLISDPSTQVRVLLDHVKLEARMLSAPPLPAMPGMPQTPQFPLFTVPPIRSEFPGVTMVNLGKATVEGLEAEGVRYVFQAVDPLRPPAISSWEVWTSTLLQLPVMTKTIGSFGQRMNVCKCVAMQPPDSLFQIPPGYTVIPFEPPAIPPVPSVPSDFARPSVPTMPSAPATPSAPTTPSLPAMPSAAPTLPSAPTMPSVPTLPSAPTMPSAPATPSAPKLPSAPTLPKLPRP